MMKKIIIIYIILYLIYFIKMDMIDKKSIFYSVYFRSNTNFFIDIKMSNGLNLNSFKKYLFLIYKLLILPFTNKNYILKIMKGCYYNMYVYKYYKDLAFKLNNKIYWYEKFLEHNISQPKIIAYNYKNKIKILEKFKINQDYIIKPISSTSGLGIKKIKGKDINFMINKYKDIIIQEFIKDCFKKESRHFRYVSLYDGRSFILNESISSNNVLISNMALGGYNYCRFSDFNSNDCNLSKNENNALNKIIFKLSKLHKNEFSNIFVIGWDIMLNCNNKNNVKAYCLEGNNIAGVWMSNNVDDNIVNKYKEEAIKFWKNNKLL